MTNSNPFNEHKKSGVPWLMISLLLVATGAISIVLWQIVESLEGNSVKVHTYIKSSKEDENDVHRTAQSILPDDIPSDISFTHENNSFAETSHQFRSGLDHLNSDRFAEGIRDFDKIISKSGDSSSSGLDYSKKFFTTFRTAAYYNRGLCYQRQKKYSLAAQDFTSAIDCAEHQHSTSIRNERKLSRL